MGRRRRTTRSGRWPDWWWTSTTGRAPGSSAEEAFNRVHRDRELPEVVQDVPIPDGASEDGVVWLPRLLVALDLASSNGDARRRIEQGGVRLDDEPVTDPSYEARREELAGKVLQVGQALVRPSGLVPVDGPANAATIPIRRAPP